MTSAGIFLSRDFSVSTGPPFDMLSTCFSHVVSRIISNKWNIKKTLNWLSYIENKGNYVIKSPFFSLAFSISVPHVTLIIYSTLYLLALYVELLRLWMYDLILYSEYRKWVQDSFSQ